MYHQLQICFHLREALLKKKEELDQTAYPMKHLLSLEHRELFILWSWRFRALLPICLLSSHKLLSRILKMNGRNLSPQVKWKLMEKVRHSSGEHIGSFSVVWLIYQKALAGFLCMYMGFDARDISFGLRHLENKNVFQLLLKIKRHPIMHFQLSASGLHKKPIATTTKAIITATKRW